MQLLITLGLLTLLGSAHAQPGTSTQQYTFTGVTGVAYSNPLRGIVTTNYGGPNTTVVVQGNSSLVAASLFSVADGILTANLSQYFDPTSASSGQVSIQVPTGSVSSVSSQMTQISTAGNISVSSTAVNPAAPFKVDITGNLVQVINATVDTLIVNANQRAPFARLLFQAVGNYKNVQYQGGPSTLSVISGNVGSVNVTMYSGSGLNISTTGTASITGSYSGAGQQGVGPAGYLFYNKGSCNVPAQSGSLPNGETTPCMQTDNVGGTIPAPQLAG